MTDAVTTRGVVKRYGSVVALAGVALRVPRGAVYGLVGPNGAGKTTLLAVLAGLRRPTEGTVEVAADRVGVLPDAPAFDTWLTAGEVVGLAGGLVGAPPQEIGAVLRQAGLERDADRRVKGFSRGMLQRLGIATTVIGRPDLLLLDEPAAALDPAGRREVLDLVAEMRGEATVVFSSHILDDVQEICDHVGILHEGRLRYQGPLEGLLEGERTEYVIELAVPAPSELLDDLAGQEWTGTIRRPGPREVRVGIRDVDAAERLLVQVLARHGVPVVALGPHRRSLEDAFLELTR